MERRKPSKARQDSPGSDGAKTGGVRFATNKSDLAKECGITRPTLYAYMEHEGFPAKAKHGWNIEECREWVLQHTRKDAVAASLDSDVDELRKWDIYERAREKKLKNDHKSDELILKRIVAESNQKAASKMRLFLYQKLCNEIPPEAREWGITTYDEFCAMAQSLGKLWE